MNAEQYRQLLNNDRKSQEMTEEDFDNTLMHFAELYHKEKLKDIDEQSKWISVEDRLPDGYCQVLVYCPQSFPKNCRFLSANYYEDNQLFYGDSDEEPHEDVTHWMLIEYPKL